MIRFDNKGSMTYVKYNNAAPVWGGKGMRSQDGRNIRAVVFKSLIFLAEKSWIPQIYLTS